MSPLPGGVCDDRLLRDVFAAIQDGVYFTDRERRITFWNQAAERISGYPAGEVLGRRCSDNILIHVDTDGTNLCKGQCPLARAMDGQCELDAKVYLHHRDGHRVPVDVHIVPIVDRTTGAVQGGIEVFSDAVDRQTLIEKIADLERLALLDPLTGVANRRYLESAVETLLDQHHRYGWPFGILFADIDDFKRINDSFSHATGDRVLRVLARTLQENVRSFDTVGRWGGEEFVLLLRNIDGTRLERIGRKMRLLVADAMFWEGERVVQVTLSQGGTMATAEDTPASLIERADRLMYESKRAGKNRLTVG